MCFQGSLLKRRGVVLGNGTFAFASFRLQGQFPPARLMEIIVFDEE
jgi:hypothetical protein